MSYNPPQVPRALPNIHKPMDYDCKTDTYKPIPPTDVPQGPIGGRAKRVEEMVFPVQDAVDDDVRGAADHMSFDRK